MDRAKHEPRYGPLCRCINPITDLNKDPNTDLGTDLGTDPIRDRVALSERVSPCNPPYAAKKKSERGENEKRERVKEIVRERE